MFLTKEITSGIPRVYKEKAIFGSLVLLTKTILGQTA